MNAEGERLDRRLETKKKVNITECVEIESFHSVTRSTCSQDSFWGNELLVDFQFRTRSSCSRTQSGLCCCITSSPKDRVVEGLFTINYLILFTIVPKEYI